MPPRRNRENRSSHLSSGAKAISPKAQVWRAAQFGGASAPKPSSCIVQSVGRSTNMQRTLVIFLKEPRAGRVKTRLGREIGMTKAAWWFRHQYARLVRRVAYDPRWQTVLAISPDLAIRSAVWPSGIARWPQGRGDLGARMGRAFRAMPPGPVVIIGADVPGITAGHIARAFAALGRDDTVFGPAPDGGFWLIGLKRGGRGIPARLFHGVRWSTEHALADTATTLAPLSIGTTDTLADVDAAEDLKKLSAT